MRLAEYIVANLEPILQEWEEFARSIWPGEVAGSPALRDHASEMILAVARNMQTEHDVKREKGATAQRLDHVSDDHAIHRVKWGFDLRELVAEYRALRTSVIRLWSESEPTPDERSLEDVVRFNEAMDRLLAESVFCYVGKVDKSREIFLAILGHDLRNPLNAVTLQSAILAESDKLDPASKKIADRIFTSVTAMGHMVGDLLDFTGSQAGSVMEVSCAPMNLRELCEEVVDEMKTIHPERSFVLESSGQLTGEWDSSRLRQVVSNLLGNALQHGFPDSPITISVRRIDDHVCLAVSNRGPAISPELLPLIFEPLKRDPIINPSRPAGSIGLGLFIAREVVTAHGGDVSVESTGEFTTFSVKLPLQCPETQKTEGSPKT